jgi:multiple sugar transport system permease protein
LQHFAVETGIKRGSIRSIKRRETFFVYICLLPVLAGLAIFVLSLLAAFAISFMDYSALKPPVFIGLKNYVDVFTKDFYFYKSLAVTFYNAIGTVAGGTIFSLFIAVLLNKKIPFRGFWRSVFYLPCVMPGMAVAILWGWLYNVDFGLFNFILRSLGLPRSLWIYGEATAIPSMWLMGFWTSGNLVIIFLAGLQTVPTVYYEAAEIDGAGSFLQFVHITIPIMSPIIFYNCLLGMIGAMQAFTSAYVLTGGGPNNATLFTVFLVYIEGFGKNRFGYAGAISFIFFIIVSLLTLLIFRTSSKWIFYEVK